MDLGKLAFIMSLINKGNGGDGSADLSDYYTKSQTDSQIAAKVAEIVANAPEDFGTLKEISDWITNHEDSAAAMNSAIVANTTAIDTKADKSTTYTKTEVNAALDSKVDKVTGKVLSSNDFTTAEKEKLAALKNYNDTDVKADIAKTAEQTALNRSTLGYQRKNLLKNTATSQTKDGIMFTVNEDDSVTVNGTASKNTFFEYFTADVKAKQKLTLSGCPTGGVVNSTYRLYVAVSNASDLGTGLTFTRNNDETLKIGIEVYAGYTAKNLTFTPMLRPAEITDATYEPYKPSVEERLAALESAVFTAQSMKINNTDTNEEKTI